MTAKNRLLLIGNGPSAAEHFYGGLIDDFKGRVLRFNNCALNDEIAPRVGTRTDIWATCGGHPVRHLNQRENLLSVPTNHAQWTPRDWAALEREDLPCSSVQRETYNTVKGEMGHHPTSGALVLRHYRQQGAEVLLHGFDFLSNPKGHHYWGNANDVKAHNPAKERRWFQGQIEKGETAIWQPCQRGYLVDQYRQIYADPDYKYVSHAEDRYRTIFHRIATDLGATSILDFGCGESTLLDTIGGDDVERHRFDPAIADFASRPQSPVDLLYTTDVLEHIPLAQLPEVLATPARHYLHAISTRVAHAHLPDGQNAHCTVRSASWWGGYLSHAYPGHQVVRVPYDASDVVIFAAIADGLRVKLPPCTEQR